MLNTVDPTENMLKKTGKRNVKYLSRLNPSQIDIAIIIAILTPMPAYWR